MKITLKQILAIAVVLFINFMILWIWYKHQLNQNKSFENIDRFDKIEEILKKDGNYPLKDKKRLQSWNWAGGV